MNSWRLGQAEQAVMGVFDHVASPANWLEFNTGTQNSFRVHVRILKDRIVEFCNRIFDDAGLVADWQGVSCLSSGDQTCEIDVLVSVPDGWAGAAVPKME